MQLKTKGLVNRRDERTFERSVVDRLRRRYWLTGHGLCIGTLVLAVMWAVSHLQMVFGSELLTLRYLMTLLVGYVVYLVILRLWSRSLLQGDSSGYWDVGGDLAGIDLPGLRGPALHEAAAPRGFTSGQGGDGGGGATGEWDDDGAATEFVSKGAASAVEAVGSSDEGAVIVVPIVAVFLIALAIVAGTGSLLLLYFGYEALLAVAVELAFAYAAGRASTRMAREGWLSAAVGLTWKPMLGALACALALGATLDYYLPEARSLPHALRLLHG